MAAKRKLAKQVIGSTEIQPAPVNQKQKSKHRHTYNNPEARKGIYFSLILDGIKYLIPMETKPALSLTMKTFKIRNMNHSLRRELSLIKEKLQNK